MNVFQAEKQQGNNTVVGWGRGWSGASRKNCIQTRARGSWKGREKGCKVRGAGDGEAQQCPVCNSWVKCEGARKTPSILYHVGIFPCWGGHTEFIVSSNIFTKSKRKGGRERRKRRMEREKGIRIFEPSTCQNSTQAPTPRNYIMGSTATVDPI